MPQKQFLPIRFPIKGLVENSAFSQQPAGTTTDTLNVRPYDAIAEKLRGGQRTGVDKYFETQFGSGNSLQAIDSFTDAFDPNSIVADEVIDENANGDTDTFEDATSDQTIQAWNPKWDNYEGGAHFDAAATGGDGFGVFDSLGASPQATGSSNRSGAAYDASVDLGSAYILTLGFQAGVNFQSFGVVWRLSADPTDRDFYVLRIDDPNTVRFVQYTGGLASTLATFIPASSITTGVEHTLEVQVNGDDASFFLDGAQLGSTQTMAIHSGNRRFGIQGDRNSTVAGDLHARRFRAATGTTPASLRTTKIVAVSNGDFYVGTPSEGLSIPTGGDDAMRAPGVVGTQEAFQDVFLCDGQSANYSYYDAGSNQVKDWATDVTAGSLPAGSVDTDQGCKYITLYRGRVVLYGLQEEPQNWFMSKSGDPFDWDYSPTTTSAIQAVAGNNSPVGELADVISALAPFQDDILVMGGANTLWIMRGDPAAGGAIDNISRSIGIVGPYAWTWDSAGVFYFFGVNGLYRMAPNGSPPELISRGRLDKTFSGIDTSANRILLVYDTEWQGVHIFVSPINEPQSSQSHYFWDQRTDSFWRDEYPTNFGPTAVHRFAADDPENNAVLLGGYDGYIREFSDAVTDDDGTNITSRVRFAPITPGGVFARTRLTDVHTVLDNASTNTSLYVASGLTPENATDNAASDTFRVKRSLIGGRNGPFRHRLSDNTHVPVLEKSGTGTWALESMGGTVEILGRVRGEG